MIRQPISYRFTLGLQIASVVLCLLFYSFLSYRQHQINPLDTTIPTLFQFIQGWKKLLALDSTGHSWLLQDSAASGYRLFTALAVGISLSFVIGLLMGVYNWAEAFFKLPILALGSVPPTAMLALYFVVFGIETKMYVAMIALGIFPALTKSIYNAAVSDVTDHAVYKAYTLGASSFEVIWEVVVQQILPKIIDNIRLCIGPAMVFLIAAEMYTADVGFGYRLKIQSRLTNMNVVYTYLILLSLFGFCLDWTLFKLRKWACPWFDLSKT